MTTSRSPLSKLKSQADRIAMLLKKAERGERIDVQFERKIREARRESLFKVGIVMDDKVITLGIPWAVIAASSEVALAAFILRHMRAGRDRW